MNEQELHEKRSAAAKRSAETRRLNKIAVEEKRAAEAEIAKNIAAEQLQKTTNKVEKHYWHGSPVYVWVILALILLGVLLWTFWKPLTSRLAALTAAPTAAPIIAPTAAPTTAPVVEPEAICPTTEQAQNLFGVSVQRIDTEACGWVWRGKPASHSAICPSDYVCTWDVVHDITVVHLGINQTAEIYAGTFRLVEAYTPEDDVYDVCALYAKEKDFGLKEVPSFEVRFQPVPGVGPQTCP